jgi:hypothetical protein
MVRHDKASCVKVRPPTQNELELFMQSNPQLLNWTADALMDGSIGLKKVTVRGRARDALPHIGDGQMDRLATSGAIAGMPGAAPLSGKDPDADEEIRDCEGDARQSSQHLLVGIARSRYQSNQKTWQWISNNTHSQAGRHCSHVRHGVSAVILQVAAIWISRQ